MDYGAMLTMRTSKKYFEWMGGLDKVSTRNHKIICWAANMLKDSWNTDLLVPLSMCGSMAAVRLPDDSISREDDQQNGVNKCEDSCQFSDLHDQLLNLYKIEVPVFTFEKKR